MARSGKSFSELFLPLQAKSSRPRRAAPAAGLPGRARLTGFALRVVPQAINLPWHRVLGAGGRIVFPISSPAHREQAKRLRAEGVVIKNGREQRSCIADLEQV